MTCILILRIIQLRTKFRSNLESLKTSKPVLGFGLTTAEETLQDTVGVYIARGDQWQGDSPRKVVVVTSVVPGGPAEKALQEGDQVQACREGRKGKAEAPCHST